MSLVELLEAVEYSLPISESPELANTVHWTPAQALPIHRWFRYREAFSPKLLNYFADSRSRLDPFCGCGTTLLESAARNVNSYGIDLNPLATFLTQTKTDSYSRSHAARFQALSQEALRVYGELKPAPKPQYELLDKIFLPESLDILLRLKQFIDSIEPGKVHNLLMLTWLSILEDSSNVFKEGNGLKYRNKRRRPGKYQTVSDEEWIPRYFGMSVRVFVERLWSQKAKEIYEDIDKLQIRDDYAPYVRTGSCLSSENLDFGHLFDLVIFSPPYANRFDYFEAFKVELWMGGFVAKAEDMARLRKNSMRNNLAASRVSHASDWPELSPFLNCMDETASSVRMGIKGALVGYFHDMRVLLQNLQPLLTDRAQVVIVVGNSAYARTIIPTDALVAKIGREEGYTVKAVKVARHLHVSSQQRAALQHADRFMRESVVILERA